MIHQYRLNGYNIIVDANSASVHTVDEAAYDIAAAADSYVNDGRDAAVSYGELDLRWVNDTPSDIILKMSYTDHSVTARLYSVYTGRTVTSEQGEWIMGETYTTKFEESDWLSAGQYYTDTAGEDGSSITVTRKVTDASGEVLIDESYTSVYQPKKEVIIVGPGTDTEPLAHKADDEDEGSSW